MKQCPFSSSHLIYDNSFLDMRNLARQARKASEAARRGGAICEPSAAVIFGGIGKISEELLTDRKTF